MFSQMAVRIPTHGERDLPKGLQLKFEAVSQMSAEDQRAIQSLIDVMILKHTASQLAAK